MTIRIYYSAAPPYRLLIESEAKSVTLPITRRHMDPDRPALVTELEIIRILATLYGEFNMELTEGQVYEFLKWGQVEV